MCLFTVMSNTMKYVAYNEHPSRDILGAFNIFPE